MILFYLLVAVMPLVRHSLWSETIIAGLTMNKWLGVACLGIALCHLALRPKPVRFFRTTQARLFVLFALLSIASFLLRSQHPAIEESPLVSFTSFLGLFLVTLVLVDSLDRLRWVLLSLIGGLAFVSLHAIHEWQAAGFSFSVRPGWVAGDPNYLSLSLLLGLPFALLLARRPWPRWQRLFASACFATMVIAFGLAGSRGGFFGFIAAFAALAHRSRNRARMLAVGGTLILLMLLALPESPLVRVISPSFGDQESNRTRSELLTAGWNMFTQNMLFGVGVGNYRYVVGGYGAPDVELKHLAHNMYLEVAAEQGVFGLLVFLAILYFALRGLNRIARAAALHRSESLLPTAALGSQLGLIGGGAAMLFLWFMIFLSCCIQALARSPARHAGQARAALAFGIEGAQLEPDRAGRSGGRSVPGALGDA
jgi:putative inorganic carbon (HCO3(-)) transporter